MDPKAYRLPRHALPRQYHARLRAVLGEDEFSGTVRIHLDIIEPQEYIELHSSGLELSGAIISEGSQRMDGEIALDPDRETARIDFPLSLPVGPATLEIDFSGRVSKGLHGLYIAEDGPNRILVTQAFPTEARTIFPCFDEPDFKARFAYEITTNPEHTVLANSPLMHRQFTGEGAFQTWVFAPTRPMSSYLVAFAIGDLEGTPEEIANQTPIRVWTVRGKEHMGRFAHDYVKRLLPFYEDYFGIPYHFDKYDQLAAPGFSFGAMENAGLVVFRQPALIMDPQTASWDQEKYIAAVVAHEFAHMWFGNLATIKWWDDVWLSESFAEWFAHRAVDVLNPEYEIWDDYQSLRREALETDALASTHPIYTHVDTPAEAIELFDAITYLKGCTVLRMLENFLGEVDFRTGLQAYMREFAESNATNADLWRHLQTASNTPVAGIMETWITQGGYPTISVATATSGDGVSLRVSQRRFFSSPRAPEENQDPLWNVPLVVRYEDDSGVREARHLLAEREAAFPLELSGSLRWLYANAGEIGFYRQRPAPDILAGLLDNLDSLTPAEQMGLMGDQWALVRSGDSTISRFLDVLSTMARLQNRGVLEQIVGHLHTVEDLLEDAGDEVALGNFRSWVGELFAERLDSLGYDPRQEESRNDAQNRVRFVDALATLAQDPDAISQATERAELEAANPPSVDPNLAPLFVAVAAQFGDIPRFNRHVQIYKARREAGASPQETQRYLRSFPIFRPPDLVARTLAMLDDGTLPQESIVPTLSWMLEHRHTRIPAWDYVRRNFEKIRAISTHAPGRIVEATGRLPIERRDEIVAFFDANLHGEAGQSYARALETIDQEAEFRSRTRADLLEWFRTATGGMQATSA